MRTKLILFAFSFAVFAQDSSVERVFHLHHLQSPQQIKEFVTTVRVISEVAEPSVDQVRRTVSVRGNGTQIAIAEWLFTELDRQIVPDSVTREFRVSNSGDDVVRLLFVPHAPTILSFTEMMSTVRTITGMSHMYGSDLTPRTLVVRGTEDQIATVAYLINELDQPMDAKRTDSPEYQIVDPAEKRGETALRVFYAPYTSTPEQFYEIATMIRTVVETWRLFTCTQPRAIIVRGTPDQVSLAGWIIHELARSANSTPSPTYKIADFDKTGENVVQVIYVKGADKMRDFQQFVTQIRTVTRMRRVFTYNATRAVAIRGTADQLAITEQMLQDRARQVAAK